MDDPTTMSKAQRFADAVEAADEMRPDDLFVDGDGDGDMNFSVDDLGHLEVRVREDEDGKKINSKLSFSPEAAIELAKWLTDVFC
jgi:hypothetical protein